MQNKSALDKAKTGIKIGLFNGEKYIADGCDFDEDNDEIAIMFGISSQETIDYEEYDDAVSVYDFS